MTDRFHADEGQATFGCAARKNPCDAHSSLSWGAGYPAAEVPSCEHGPMKRIDGADHEATVTEEQLLEAEVRRELEAEASATRRAALKAEIRRRLLAEERTEA